MSVPWTGTTPRASRRGTGGHAAARSSRGVDAATRHRLFGLTVSSAIKLPLPVSTDDVDVTVELGSVDPMGVPIVGTGGAARFICLRHGDDVVLAWPGATFRVGAERVIVDARDRELASHLLLTVVWSVVMSARGTEALHGSVVERGGRAVAFLGASGAGKSTACGMLIELGCRMVTDDLVVLNGAGAVVPGPPFLRLPDDPWSVLPQPADAGGKVRIALPVRSNPVLLTAIVVLTPEHRARGMLSGLAALDAILVHSYNTAPTHPGQGRHRLEQALSLVERLPIRAEPPRSLTPDRAGRLMSEGW